MASSISFSSSTPFLRPSAFLLKPRSISRLPFVRAKIREIFMPALSSTMTEGKIISWTKSEGDILSKGESVVVVESDKVDMDVETFYYGILAAIVISEGETAPVGAPIGLLWTKSQKLGLKPRLNLIVSCRIGPPKVEESAHVAAKVESPSPAVAPKGATSFPEIPGSKVVPFTTMQAAVSKNMVESLCVPTFRVGYPIATDALDALYEKVEDIGKYKDDGCPVKRPRKKVIIVHAGNIASIRFWNDKHEQLPF